MWKGHAGHYSGQGYEWGGNNRCTNVSNVHTGAVCSMNLVVATVGVIHRELVKIADDVVHRARVSVPRIVDSRECRHACGVRFNHRVFFISVPTLLDGVADLGTDLALGPGHRGVAGTVA
jgi:hypothetical protein